MNNFFNKYASELTLIGIFLIPSLVESFKPSNSGAFQILFISQAFIVIVCLSIIFSEIKSWEVLDRKNMQIWDLLPLAFVITLLLEVSLGASSFIKYGYQRIPDEFLYILLWFLVLIPISWSYFFLVRRKFFSRTINRFILASALLLSWMIALEFILFLSHIQ